MRAVVPVTPGETLDVYVGGEGADASDGYSGGFNGGASGGGGGGKGIGGSGAWGGSYASGGGGGGSSYVEAASISHREWRGWINASGIGKIVFSW